MANVSELNEVQLFIDHMPFDNTQLFQGDFRKRNIEKVAAVVTEKKDTELTAGLLEFKNKYVNVTKY